MLMTFFHYQTAKWVELLLLINSQFVTQVMKWSQQWMSGSMVETRGQQLLKHKKKDAQTLKWQIKNR